MKHDPISATTVDAREFRDALRLASIVVRRKNSVPVLSCVRLTARAGVVTIAGTDLDQEIVATLPGVTGAEIDVALPPSLLGYVAGAGDVLTITKEPDESYRLACGAASLRLSGSSTIPAADFPVPPLMEWETLAEVGEAKLRGWLNMVAGAISTEEVRYYLNGAFFRGRDGTLEIEAMDGHRLYRVATGATWSRKADILPRGTVNSLLRVLSAKGNGTVRILAPLTEQYPRLCFECPSANINTKMIEGTFPNMDHIVPAPEKQKLVACITAADVRLLLSDRKAGLYAARLNASEGIVTQQNHEGVEIAVSIERIEGAPEIAMNAGYLRDAIARFGDIEIWAESPDHPCRFRVADDRVTCIVMPMRV